MTRSEVYEQLSDAALQLMLDSALEVCAQCRRERNRRRAATKTVRKAYVDDTRGPELLRRLRAGESRRQLAEAFGLSYAYLCLQIRMAKWHEANSTKAPGRWIGPPLARVWWTPPLEAGREDP